tara:strand:+ start:540 stop:914 length:375 start_codon:yes stop_codon:yes gene_type:complete
MTQLKINKEVFKHLIHENDGKMIFKFTATWCAPCKRAAPFINDHLDKIKQDISEGKNENTIRFFEIDIDESVDVYGLLKSKRMIQGVPSLIFYDSENKTLWPDIAISSSKESDINYFFESVVNA